MPTETTLFIRDLQSLLAWRRLLQTTLQPRKLPTIEVRISEFSPTENLNLSARAAQLQNACGCGTSGMFMSATLVSLMLSYFIRGNGFADMTLSHFLALIACMVLAALCGKTLGLLLARWQMLELAAGMRDRIVMTSIEHVYR
jgi:hypothetical protein